jgi:hypothetical protein
MTVGGRHPAVSTPREADILVASDGAVVGPCAAEKKQPLAIRSSGEGPLGQDLQRSLSNLTIKKKKCLTSRRKCSVIRTFYQGVWGLGWGLVAILAGTSGGGGQLPPSVDGRGRLGYPAASRPRAEGIMLMPDLVGHGYETFGSPCVEAIYIKRASVWRLSAVAKVEVLKEFEQC